MERKIVIFDIDGTLADHSRRLCHINGVTKDWAAYYAGCENDPVIEQIAELLDLTNCYDHLFITGRTEEHRQQTVNWLVQNLDYSPTLADKMLLMRPNGDYRKAHELKWELFCKAGYTPKDVLFAVEDSARIASMWREHGIVCLQVADGDY